MGRKFGRKVILQLGENSYEDFKITFDIRKTLSGEPNTGQFKIHNLSWETVGNLLVDYRNLRVRLLAGYDNIPALLFEGNIIRNGLKVTKDATERIVEIEAQTGIRAYQSARVNVSFEKDTTYRTVLREVARQLGYPQTVIVDSPGLDKRIQSGLCLSGKASKVLDDLAETVGQYWTIRDENTIQFVPEEGGTLPERGPRFSRELNNIINSPEPTDVGVQLTTFLTPIEPGERFVIDRTEDSRLAGNFRAESVQYTGDTGFETQFYSSIEGRRLQVET